MGNGGAVFFALPKNKKSCIIYDIGDTSPTYEQAHVGLDLLTLISIYLDFYIVEDL